MARYINVDELRMKIHDKYTISYFKPTKEDMQLIGIFEIINAQPTADVVEIPKIDIGDLSDGYHTFNELYHHRAVLFSVICNSMPDKAWKSKLHDTGDMYEGMFIVGIETPDGQATYHYDIEPYWDMFKVRELEKAPKWDGHTPTDAINRIANLSADVAEVKHGEWKDKYGGKYHNKLYVCSLCGEKALHGYYMNELYQVKDRQVLTDYCVAKRHFMGTI